MSTKKGKTKKKYTLDHLKNDFGPFTFGDFLESVRDREGLTQTQLAKKLDITRQKLCDYEKDRRSPSIETVATWAKKIKEPADFWVQMLIEDQLRRAKMKYKVKLERV